MREILFRGKRKNTQDWVYGDFEGMEKAGGSAVAYAWFIWEKKTERNANPTIGWL